MATRVLIKHQASGLTRNGYVGFSWTYLFFGFLVPMFRGELGISALHLFFSIITGFIWQLYACFMYNKWFMTRMLTRGWVLADSETMNTLAAQKLGMVRPAS